MSALAKIDGLTAYLEQYGRVLADQVLTLFDPLHVRGRDPDFDPALLRRPLFAAQADTVCALARTLRAGNALLLAKVGTGKTVMALGLGQMLHSGRPYRGVVMCPDHLIGKWARHVQDWVPGAKVFGWDGKKSWGPFDWARLADDRPGPATGPEWYILGRDASKLDPAWEPAAVPRSRLAVERTETTWRERDEPDPDAADLGEPGRSRVRLVETARNGRRLFEIRTYHRFTVWTCPRCGATLTAGKEKVPAEYAWLARAKRSCPNPAPEPAGGWPDEPGFQPPKCGEPLWRFVARRRGRPGPPRVRCAAGREMESWAVASRARWEGWRKAAGKPARTALPWRWAPARTVHRRLRGFFDLFVLDEAHEEKSEESAQSIAAGKLIAASRRAAALTGTLMGGYAWHLFPLLFRLAPAALLDDGFAWGDLMKFSERYGRLEERIEYPGAPDAVANHSHSMGKTGRERTVRVRPGIVPTVFGDHLMSRTVFLELEQISDDLPPRPAEEVIGVAMDPDQRDDYLRLEAAIRQAIAPMIREGNLSLLGRMLHGLLGWPDHPFGYRDDGYFLPFGITEAPDLDPNRVFPKERALVELCRAEADAGRQVWVYVQMTRERDIRPRLADLLADAGLTAEILDASLDRSKREAWIHSRGDRLNVAISHPMLVQTGLELFDPRPGGSHFCTIVFYQTGYNPFTLLQAGGRAWRIGQQKDCRTVYLYYQETMQAQAIDLMAKKVEAANILAGRFSAEGLAALSDDGTLELALAKRLVEHVAAARPSWPGARPPAPLARLANDGGRPALPAPAVGETLVALPGPLPGPPRPGAAGGRRWRPDMPGQRTLFDEP